MKLLIVNADDFGLTAGVNRAIVEAHQHGIVTSATLMANMPAFDEAVALAKAHPTLGVGLHFNLTQGRPVAAAASVRSLLDERGEFLGTSTALAWRSWRGQVASSHIKIELCAQLDKAIAAGLRLTHLDSHKHAHALPQVFRAVVETLPSYGIQALRMPRERVRWTRVGNAKQFKQSLTALGLAQLCGINQRQLVRAALQTTNAFIGITQTGFWSKAWLQDSLCALPDGVTELMCHPGYADQGLQAVQTRLRASREAELRLLTNPEIVAFIQSRDIRLIHFGQLQSAF